MGNIWDLPEQSHPVHGRKRKHVEHHEHEEHEEGFERVGKTITDAAIVMVGIGGTLALGAGILGALKPK